tara:strand:+ start:415 stop:1134 length:720 start_codon:yes stop_codon:yes gene_type:complete
MTNLFDQVTHSKEVNDYYHILNSSNILNVYYWSIYFNLIKNIKGDIVECGVGRGRSLITLLSLNRYYESISNNKIRRKIYALDSFSGFPEPTKEDNSSRNPKKGEWSRSPNNEFNYSVENLKKILKKADLGNLRKNQLNIIKGFFEKTTKDLKIKKISILHLDGDLYKSIKDPLENLSNKVVKGGIIVIDDFYLKKNKHSKEDFPGARRALEDFLDENKEFKLKESIRGTPYLIRYKIL